VSRFGLRREVVVVVVLFTGRGQGGRSKGCRVVHRDLLWCVLMPVSCPCCASAEPRVGLIWADLNKERLEQFYATEDEDEQVR
jgi:hypothetical protein